MLFNSYIFLLLFLPVVAIGGYALGLLTRRQWALVWLIAASLVFYAYWKIDYSLLFVASIGVNWSLGRLISDLPDIRRRLRLALMWLGVAVNLGGLGWFKYAAFLADNLNALLNAEMNVLGVVLPLAISFYTFQQIGFLVDCYRRTTAERSVLRYALFVSFFPQLIAGPIVRHQDLARQLTTVRMLRPVPRNIATGLCLIGLGLFKKVALADSAAAFADPLFRAAETGAALGFVDSWTAALLFGFVIYFDFSGYSDMALGLARLFNVRLPINFHSPYKAASIIDFWRRWHITLSIFLRDYLYIPLGGNRHGRHRQMVNIMLTMLLGGLWHGAGWTFVIWGGLHGSYIVINHVWRDMRQRRARRDGAGGVVPRSRLPRPFWVLLTFLAVTVAWVFFRAADFGSAMAVLTGMAGLGGLGLPVLTLDGAGLAALAPAGLVALLAAIVWLLPNSHQFMALYQPALHMPRPLPRRGLAALRWRPTPAWVIVILALWAYGLSRLEVVQAFVYFQF